MAGDGPDFPVAARGIVLEDHEGEGFGGAEGPAKWYGSVLWARDVRIDGYIVVEGSGPGLGVGVGSYVVWNCEVQTLDGGVLMLRKR